VRLFGVNKPTVLTGSIDHTLKVWDISRKTYRQEMTLRHNSTSTCVDVASDSTTIVSGHMDGGLRFWDLRSGERTTDASGTYSSLPSTRYSYDSFIFTLALTVKTLYSIAVTHEGGTSSVQFKPTDNTQVLTSSMDSSLKIIDVRTMKAIHTFIHSEQITSGQNWSRSTFSPDGRYVATCSSSTPVVYIWDTLDRSIKGRLNCGNTAGIISVDWFRNKSSNEPHVASLDRKGILVLWGVKE
jgi:autophagy-related protein 16-1